MKRILKKTTLAAVAALVVFALVGCYWTPQQDEGGVTINIDASNLGASQTFEDYSGFFLGYVIAGDLLRGDEAAADQAFEEVNTAFEEAFNDLGTTQDLSDFRVNLSFPSIQLQANLFTGDSGSNSFRGLVAGREYVVVVVATDFANTSETYEGDLGFSAVTIEGGETKEVNLGLGNRWAEFDEFLTDRYGYRPTEEQDTTSSVDLSLSVQASGRLTTVPETLYYDLIDANETPIYLSSYFDTYLQEVYVNETGPLGSQPALSTRLDNATLLNPDGSIVSDPTSGTRSSLAADGTISGVQTGRYLQVVLVDQSNRATTAPGNAAIAISEPFLVDSTSASRSVALYEWATGF